MSVGAACSGLFRALAAACGAERGDQAFWGAPGSDGVLAGLHAGGGQREGCPPHVGFADQGPRCQLVADSSAAR